jgi:hypothetical protein
VCVCIEYVDCRNGLLLNSIIAICKVKQFNIEMTNVLDIDRLFLIKAHDVSETGVCLRHQIKDNYSVGPNG